ncbi:MAG TPA: PLP-dependent aminotransferase family protein [Frankiaceae bacterium]|nr:PLP-dependent aminotransferase family protein [Frankiaceae bacterium]
MYESEGAGAGWQEGLLAGRARGMTSSVIRDLLALTSRPEIISLAGGLPDAAALPSEWLRACANALLEAEGPGLLQYSTTEGDPQLRELIAGWESEWCGRAVSADDVLVTSGSQQALDLLAKVLIEPRDVVVTTDPAYLGALQAFQLFQPRLVAIAEDDEGMRVDLLADALVAGLRPKLVYLTPTFANPSGTTMPAERRKALASLADRYGFLVAEDDAYRQLYFGSPPPAPIASSSDRVVRLGSFSKVLGPGLRVGWIVSPPQLRSAFVRAKQATDLHTSTFTQRLLHAAASDAPLLGDHLQRTRSTYSERARALVDGLRASFGDRIELADPQGGMFCWARFVDGTSPAELLTAALDRGVAFIPGDAFSVPGTDGSSGESARGARLCFATSPPDVLREAVRRLTEAAAPG